MNTELLEALNILEKEKDISKETILDAIENSLLNACKNHFGKADNIKLIMDRETCDYQLLAEKTVVEEPEDELEEISLEKAKEIDSKYELGDVVQIPIESKSFGRIATQNAKNLILQKIREEERKVVYDQYFEKEKDIVTGIVQRYVGKNISINLGKADAMLTENEQVKGETVCSGSEEYNQGAENPGVQDASGAGKETVRGRGYGSEGRYRGDQKYCQRGRKPYKDRGVVQ